MVVSQKEKRESCSLVWVIPFTSFGQMFAPEKITKPFLMSIKSKKMLCDGILTYPIGSMFDRFAYLDG